jgi:hypothetical protein
MMVVSNTSGWRPHGTARRDDLRGSCFSTGLFHRYEEVAVQGYVVAKGSRYAVIYEASTRSPVANADGGILLDRIDARPSHSPGALQQPRTHNIVIAD